MARQFLPLVLLTVLLSPAWAESGQAPPAQKSPTIQSERVRQGVSHFERAFYQLTPQKRDREAAQEFDQAIAQFEGRVDPAAILGGGAPVPRAASTPSARTTGSPPSITTG